jgi:hypothetical protein
MASSLVSGHGRCEKTSASSSQRSAEAEQQFAAVIAGEEIGHAAVIALGGVVFPRIADGVDGIVVVIQPSLCEVGAQLGRDLVIPGLAELGGRELGLHHLLDLVPS